MIKNVTIIRFSPRNNGNCDKIADFIANFYNRTNVLSFWINADNCLPCNGCNYECLIPGSTGCPTKSDYLTEVMDQALASDLVYFIVPNFCGYPNSNYFAFNERLVGYFGTNRGARGQYMAIEKRFIIVSNTESDNFRNAMQQQVIGEPKMLYLKSGKYHKRSTDGDILESEDAQRDLGVFLAGKTN